MDQRIKGASCVCTESASKAYRLCRTWACCNMLFMRTCHERRQVAVQETKTAVMFMPCSHVNSQHSATACAIQPPSYMPDNHTACAARGLLFVSRAMQVATCDGGHAMLLQSNAIEPQHNRTRVLRSAGHQHVGCCQQRPIKTLRGYMWDAHVWCSCSCGSSASMPCTR